METKPTEKKNKINVNCRENKILQERKSDRPVTVTRGLNADGPPTEKQGLGGRADTSASGAVGAEG